MSEKSFSERLNDLVRISRQREQEARQKHADREKAKKLARDNFIVVKYETGAKLEKLEILKTMREIERAMIDLYGLPPEASLRLRLLRGVSQAGFSHSETDIYGDEKVGISYRDVKAGVRPREPFGSNDHDWSRTRVSEFSLSAVCRYTAKGAGLALGAGLYTHSNNPQSAEFCNPIHETTKITTPYIPLADWTKERFQELAWDVVAQSPKAKALLG